MIIAIPVSRSDISLLPHLINSMVHFGGFEAHRVIVLPTPSCASDAATAAGKLNGLCRQLDVATLNIEPEGGWPQACNQHFAGALEKMNELGIDEPWLWTEPDCTFTAYDPVNKLLAEHNQGRKPFTGHLRDTKEVMVGADGQHMVACGIYPPDFYGRTRLWQHARPDQPFDVWLRWEIAPKCLNTKLIQHCPRSAGYTKIGAGISGKSKEGEKTFTIDPSAVMVHGCKDGSLSKVVCGDYIPPIPAPKEREKSLIEQGLVTDDTYYPFTQTVFLPQATAEDLDNDGFKAILGAIKEWKIQVPGETQNAALSTPAHAKAILTALQELALKEEPKNPLAATNSVEQNLMEHLVTSPKNEDIVDDAAKILSVSPEYLRDLVGENSKTFKLSGPGDIFVRLTAKGIKMAGKS